MNPNVDSNDPCSVASGQFLGDRNRQEDTLATFAGHFPSPEDRYQQVLVLADGMGGHVGGDLASRTAVAAFEKSFRNSGRETVPARLRRALFAANDALLEKITVHPQYRGMGTTLTAVVISDQSFEWISVGDSPLWLLRKKQLIRVNADHSAAGLARQRVVAEAFAFSSNVLCSSLTGQHISLIDQPEAPKPLQPGDRLILASDGLEILSDWEIVHAIPAGRTSRQVVHDLLDEVKRLDSTGRDNASVLVYSA